MIRASIIAIFMMVIATVSGQSLETERKIKEQIRYIQDIGYDSNIYLAGNTAFLQWLLTRGPASYLPKREEQLWAYITNRNMYDNLYGLYMWTSPNNFHKRGYLQFL